MMIAFTGQKLCLPGCRTLDFRHHSLELFDSVLVPLIEGPLPDSLPPNQPGLRQDSKVLTRGWLAYAKFPGDQNAAHAVLYQISVHLGREVSSRLLEPLQNLQPARVGERAKCEVSSHIDN